MIFVTGGTGLLGMRMVYDLLVKGEQLRLLRREGSDMQLFEHVMDFYHGGDSSRLYESIEWIIGDVLDIQVIEEALQGCSHCIHAAALVSFHARDHERMRVVNIQGTANVVDACLGIPGIRLLYVSSVASLGRAGNKELINEEELWKDSPENSGYAISKYHAEMEVWRGIEEGLSAVMINPTIILGAGSKSKSSGSIFGVVVNGLRFYTDGIASVVDARDVSKIGIELLFGPVTAQRFVVSASSLPYKELFAKIAERLGHKAPHIYVGKTLQGLVWRALWIKDLVFRSKSPVTRETALSASSHYRYDNKKIKSELDVQFQSVDETVDYFASFYSSSS